MSKLWLAFILILAGPTCSAEKTYSNPVDGKRYSTGKWRTYQPKGGVPACPGKVCLGGVRLLQDQREIAERTTAEELSKLIGKAMEAAKLALADQSRPLEVMVQFTCDPIINKVELAYQGDVTQEVLQSLYDALGKIPPIATSDTVLLQFTVRVAP